MSPFIMHTKLEKEIPDNVKRLNGSNLFLVKVTQPFMNYFSSSDFCYRLIHFSYFNLFLDQLHISKSLSLKRNRSFNSGFNSN